MVEVKEGFEERLARVEGILSQMDKRLSNLETLVRWNLGIITTMWVTIILAILYKG